MFGCLTHFEKHVAVDTEQYPKNGYSATPEDVDKWLSSMVKAYEMCGVEGERHSFSVKEISEGELFQIQKSRSFKITEEEYNHYFHKWLYYYGGAGDVVSLEQYIKDYDSDDYGDIDKYDTGLCPCVMCLEENIDG